MFLVYEGHWQRAMFPTQQDAVIYATDLAEEIVEDMVYAPLDRTLRAVRAVEVRTVNADGELAARCIGRCDLEEGTGVFFDTMGVLA